MVRQESVYRPTAASTPCPLEDVDRLGSDEGDDGDEGEPCSGPPSNPVRLGRISLNGQADGDHQQGDQGVARQ